MNKHWYKSKTIWSNFVALAVIVATLASNFFPSVDPTMAGKIAAAEGSFLSVVNIVLRLITNTGLSK